MRPDVLLQLLRCPECREQLEFEDSAGAGGREGGALLCRAGHRFAVDDGLPRLASGGLVDADARSINASFSRQWASFRHEMGDRTWGHDVEDRVQDLLRHLNQTAGDLAGKIVLDAGCGNGALSHAITRFGCNVVAADLSDSVEAAHRRFGHGGSERLQFVQADVTRPPFADGVFDVVYCAGVLHHTKSTRASFDRLVVVVKPGGRMFVWLYWHVPGKLLALKAAMREAIAPLPARVKYAVVLPLLPQAMLRQYLRTLRGSAPQSDRLRWRERLVVLLDSYTPRYRWEHTPEELIGWFEAAGFADARVTERDTWGFGVVAIRPETREPLATRPQETSLADLSERAQPPALRP